MNPTTSPTELRRMATAVHNVIAQVPAGRGQWCAWVVTQLRQAADEIEQGES